MSSTQLAETNNIEILFHLSNLESKCYYGPSRLTNPILRDGIFKYQYSYYQIRFKQLDKPLASTIVADQIRDLRRQAP